MLGRFSPSNFGFSDSADIFVFLAGISTYLAYGQQAFRESLIALWRRALRLYKYNLVLIAATLACLLLLASLVGAKVMLEERLVSALTARDLVFVTWNIAALLQSVGFSMVLRLYVALMLLAPVLLWLASKRWWLPLPPVVAIWAVAGHFRLVAHDSLTGTPLMITILPWTLIFTCGLSLAAAIAQNVKLPKSFWLTALALGVVLGVFGLLYAPSTWTSGQAWIQARNDQFWFGASKCYQSPLRVLHLLSLVYLFLRFAKAPVLRLIHGVGPDNVFARLGRRSLQVFTLGAVFAVPANELVHLANRQWGAASPGAIALECLLVLTGLVLMTTVARTVGQPAKRPTSRLETNASGA